MEDTAWDGYGYGHCDGWGNINDTTGHGIMKARKSHGFSSGWALVRGFSSI